MVIGWMSLFVSAGGIPLRGGEGGGRGERGCSSLPSARESSLAAVAAPSAAEKRAKCLSFSRISVQDECKGNATNGYVVAR